MEIEKHPKLSFQVVASPEEKNLEWNTRQPPNK